MIQHMVVSTSSPTAYASFSSAMDAPESPPQPANSSAVTTTAVDAADDPLSSSYASLNSHCYELSILQDLACRGAWRTILDKVARSRSLSLLSKPHEHLIYLTFNVLSLVKLRRYSDAQQELQTLDDDLESKQYLFESYPDHYPSRSGSMIPFALRWLHAHSPFTLGDRQLSLDRLYSLVNFIRDKKLSRNHDLTGETSTILWKKRETFVINSIVSHHLSQKEFKVCIHLLKAEISKNEDPFLVSKLGYVQMQYGDLDGAKRSFEFVQKSVENSENDDVSLKNLVGRNKAMVYLVGKDFISAVREYEECIERDGSDGVAINNKALCLMYLRDLSDSIKVLESALERVPTVALNETLVVNMCSMYELAYVNHADIKKTLSTWIARVAPDDFDSSCTRI